MLQWSDDTYLVEIRLGRTKWRIRELIRSIARSFNAEDAMEPHPHITLYGPFTLPARTNPRELLTIIGDIAGNYGPVDFTIDGWEQKTGMHGSVIAFRILPSEALRSLVADISRSLQPVVESSNAWDDLPEKKWYHSTILNRIDSCTADRIFSSLSGNVSFPDTDPGDRSILDQIINRVFLPNTPATHPVFTPPLLDETGLRITLMKGEHIFAEYDLMERRWIHTGHDHDSISWQKTLLAFRCGAGFELKDPVISNETSPFVISDLHLGHANIIRYCSRPFRYSDPAEMDHVLIKNWNYTIAPANRVYHLGDLRYGKSAPRASAYRKRLHGQITFITGNHDDPELDGIPSARIDSNGIPFLLIHNPADAPPGYDGWVIHGHHHNNDLRHYPYIDPASRRVNVSAEVLGYTPISLGEISHRIQELAPSGDSAPILLRYPHIS